jgi:hypothetical protein
MAELIHDIAPGAAISFHSTFNSRLDFAEAIDELRLCGADLLVDDTLYLEEPMFQDGLVAQAVQRAFDAGVPYFSAAGNQALFGVDESFDDYLAEDEELDEPSGRDFHRFGSGGDPYAAVTLPNGCGITAVLQWNEPFDDPLGAGARIDLDLYLCEQDGGQPPPLPPFNPQQSTCQVMSQDAQGCGAGSPDVGFGDPLEVVSYVNNSGAAKTVYLAVDHYCGDVDNNFQEDDDAHFRLATFGRDCSLADPGYDFETGIFDRAQIYGHSAAAGATAVAAVYYQEIDSGGTTDPPAGQIDVEPFASLGGELPFYFDELGDPLPGAPQTRFKPDVASADGSNTTFFGSDIPDDPDSDPNFFGSSAAVANAAAVAALVMETNPLLTSSDVQQVLEQSARDIEVAGVDPLSGHGLLDALAAADLSLPELQVVPTAFDAGEIGVGDTVPQAVTLTNSASGPAVLHLTAMALSDPVNFSVSVAGGDQPCGSMTPSLSPGASCTIEVIFSPTAEGTFLETLTFDSNAAEVLLPLSGSAKIAAIAVDITADPITVAEPGGLIAFAIQVQNLSAQSDPVILDSLTDDRFGDLTDPDNPLIEDTTCSIGPAILAGDLYSCLFHAWVSGTSGDTHVNVVSASGTDDEGDVVADSDSATVSITDPPVENVFADGFESGDLSAWSVHVP